MEFDTLTELKKELYNLTNDNKHKAIKYLLDLIKEDLEDLKPNNTFM